MPLMPFAMLGIWFRGVLALGLLGGGILAPRHLVRRAATSDPSGPDGPRGPAAPGLAAVFSATSGPMAPRPDLGDCGVGWWDPPRTRGQWRWEAGVPPPVAGQWARARAPPAGRVQRLTRPDGTELHIESFGPPDAPPVLLTHGWGVTSAQWYYLLQEVGERFRVVVWDLPGVGRSTRPTTADYSLDKMARDFEAILTLLGPCPVVLVGHSPG